ncbi:MAG: hypothetical protein WBA35_06440, partial [Litorimonas sp.]
PNRPARSHGRSWTFSPPLMEATTMGRKPQEGKAHNKVTTSRLDVMQTPAWRALPTSSQALYVWIKHEWRGKKFNNNGKLRLSVRQA